MKLAVPQFLKSKPPKPAKAKPAVKPRPVVLPPPLPAPRINGNAPRAPKRYLRRGDVMRVLGISKREFRKWVEAGLLKPHRRPDPHRLSGRNRSWRSGPRALFLWSEVEAVRLENA